MKYQEGLAALKFRREKNYALTGMEDFLKEQFVKKAISVFTECDPVMFYPGQESEALDILKSESLFSKFLIVLRDFEKMKSEKFEDLIKSVDGCIILVFSEKVDLKSRSITKIISHTSVVECDKLKEYGSEYPIWIRTHVIDNGYTMQEGADTALYSKIGPSLFSIGTELEKLFLIKKDKIITIKDVQNYVSLTASSTAYELLDAFLRKDVKGALQCFDSYSRTQDNFIEIVYFIGAYLEKMYRMILLKEEKMDAEDIAGILSIPAFLIKTKYLPRVSNLGKSFIASKIDALCNLDAQLRNFRADKKILFDRFILGFSQ
jgi:DNA polymerase III delta subunit